MGGMAVVAVAVVAVAVEVAATAVGVGAAVAVIIGAAVAATGVLAGDDDDAEEATARWRFCWCWSCSSRRSRAARSAGGSEKSHAMAWRTQLAHSGCTSSHWWCWADQPSGLAYVGYSSAYPGGGTFILRILHRTQPARDFLCDFRGGICGWNTDAGREHE